jgi:hypothetical protein
MDFALGRRRRAVPLALETNRMKPLCQKRFQLALIFILTGASSSLAQGNFEDLNFESANIQPSQAAGTVNASDALPGWTVYFGTAPQTQVGYNQVSTGSTWVTLLGQSGSGTIYNSLDANFSVLLQGGVTASAASIEQTGTIPANSESIQFIAQPGFGTLIVYLNGQNIPLSQIGNGPNYTTYGGNVSSFAGQTAILEISALNAGAAGRNDWNIDDIQFSTQPIPEPQTWTLLLCGAGALALWRRKQTQ